MSSKTSDKHKFSEDASMTFQEVFTFAHKRFISLMRHLANELGEDHFMEILKTAATKDALQGGQNKAKSLPYNDFAAFKAWETGQDHFKKTCIDL